MTTSSRFRQPDIICYGDSLTVGYQSPTVDHPDYQETPYGGFLRQYLGDTWRVVVSGICGELTAEMANRFHQDVLEHRPRYVIILGGTNDLGWNLSSEEIFTNLSLMYNQAYAADITPIAITIPSLRPLSMTDTGVSRESQLVNSPEWPMIRSHIERRLVLNRQIQEYCDSHQITCIDLFSETAEPDSNLLALPFSNDGLHLSTQGYQRLAELLWKQVFAAKNSL